MLDIIEAIGTKPDVKTYNMLMQCAAELGTGIEWKAVLLLFSHEELEVNI